MMPVKAYIIFSSSAQDRQTRKRDGCGPRLINTQV